MLNKKNQKGFTLIEIIIAMAIITLLITISSKFIIKTIRSTVFESEMETAIKHARRAVNIMTKELRGANNSEMGEYPLINIEEENLIFFSDIDDDEKMEKIQYYLDGTHLKKVVTEPGPANDYNMPTSTTIISEFVNNQETPIFNYFDNNYNQTDIINEIRLINIVLEINVTPERAPYNYQLETDVNLRNLKDNL